MKTEKQQIQEYTNWKQKCLTRGYFFEVERTDIINALIKKNEYINYLEIGVHDGNNIKRINAAHIDGVDPGIEGHDVPETNYKITSDRFFSAINGHNIKYDIIFIDGLHLDYQVYKDIINSLNHITSNGTIVCHDMNPKWELSTGTKPDGVCWNGSCWKAWVKLRSEKDNLKMYVVDTDHGVGIIQAGNQNIITLPKKAFDLDFEYLENNRNEILNLISIKTFDNINNTNNTK